MTKHKPPRIHLSTGIITGTLQRLPDGRLGVAGRVERREAPYVEAWPWPLFRLRGDNDAT